MLSILLRKSFATRDLKVVLTCFNYGSSYFKSKSFGLVCNKYMSQTDRFERFVYKHKLSVETCLSRRCRKNCTKCNETGYLPFHKTNCEAPVIRFKVQKILTVLSTSFSWLPQNSDRRCLTTAKTCLRIL